MIARTLFTLLAGGAMLAPAFAQVAQPTSAQIVQAAEGRLPVFLQCLRNEGVAMIGAHRGGPLPEHPENAIVTMERTTSMAPVFVEVDVQESADGVLFLNHDPVLDRNTTGTGKISEKSWAEISALKQRDPTAQPTQYAPPLFADVLNWAKGRTLLMVDSKPNTDIGKLVAEVSKAGADGRVMYLTYSLDHTKALLKHRPNAVFAMIVFRDGRGHYEEAVDQLKGAGLLGPNAIALVPVGKSNDQALVERLMKEVRAAGASISAGSYGGPKQPDAVYRTIADADAYLNLAGRGQQIMVSNRPIEAATAVFSNADYRAKFSKCLTR